MTSSIEYRYTTAGMLPILRSVHHFLVSFKPPNFAMSSSPKTWQTSYVEIQGCESRCPLSLLTDLSPVFHPFVYFVLTTIFGVVVFIAEQLVEEAQTFDVVLALEVCSEELSEIERKER